jgi:branched-chain amino acid transport system substrate-binding protein
MFSKLFGLGLLAAVAAVAAPAYAQETVKIGVLTDRTGGAKFYAEPVTEGIILGFEEINAKGGILGKKVELIIEDDQNVPDVSATKARKLVDSGVVFMMSNSASPVTLQASTVSLETKTPHMTPANSADFLTTRLQNPYFWQTGPLASQQFATLMSFVKARNFKNVALVTDNSELGLANAGSFRTGFEKLGIKIVSDEVIPGGTTTAIPQMQKIRAGNVDAIFQAGVLGPEMALFFKAYHELGLKQPVLGSYNLSIPAYLTIAKDLMNGVAFIDGFDQDKPEAKAFIAAYKKRYNKDPFSLHAYGYDAAYLVADAIKRAGSTTDKEKIRAAMQATKGWTGAVGAKGASVTFGEKRAGFDPNGAVVRIIENNNHGKVVHSGAM